MPLSTQPFAHVKALDTVAPESKINLAQSERIASLAGGTALALYGVAQRSLGGALLALLGGGLVYRGVTGRCELYRRLGVNTATGYDERGVPGNKGFNIERSVRIERAPTQVYHYWRNLENLPKFMPHVASVEQRSDRLSHWTVRGPAGVRVEWDAEIINDHAGEMIAWQSIPGAAVENAGSVRFTPADRGRATDLRVALQYYPPAGAFGTVIAKILRGAPDQQIPVDLERFKRLVESDGDNGEPS